MERLNESSDSVMRRLKFVMLVPLSEAGIE